MSPELEAAINAFLPNLLAFLLRDQQLHYTRSNAPFGCAPACPACRVLDAFNKEEK